MNTLYSIQTCRDHRQKMICFQKAVFRTFIEDIFTEIYKESLSKIQRDFLLERLWKSNMEISKPEAVRRMTDT